MRHWIFDLDGTLIDSMASYTRVLNEVLADYNVQLSAADHIHIRHLVLPKFLERFLKPEHTAEAFEKVIALCLARQHEVKPFHGIDDLLVFLKSKGRRLSVFTARELKTAQAILLETGLHRHFEQLASRSCVVNTKPHPDGIHMILAQSKSLPHETLMIGDHRMDVEAAKAAGVKSVSVCWDNADSSLLGFSDHHFTGVADLHLWATEQI